MGELISETFPFDGSRQVTLYMPTRKVEAIFYYGDGEFTPL